ncbi:LysR family transcriptional activator of nhaA [Polymorphobacter multimanifer]|uniref:LysR family transcriptional activator of nhaA n=2 Tax=Polymorphobacter multimanifer TaxID=1070431 RepID=A0A841L9P0_9SPHN|nr:LysR family transcriptional regulator [Polymorphobacter multimanifer]MBB6228866.1 LysR family transcriptional activator of nhaA [Polymorphobacter multimanifer]
MAEMNYNHLRYFWAVAQDGNLTRTAERLNVSQSALSVQIRKLEHGLGHTLFERRGRQLHLTEAGRITLDHADAIFATGRDLMGTLQQTGTVRQAVRIGALATLSRNFQIGFLRPLLGRDDIEVILRSGSAAELLRGLQALNLDIVLTNQVPEIDALTPFIAHKLSEQHVGLVGTPRLIGARRSVADLLARHPLILPTQGSTIRIGFDALAVQLGISPQIAAEVDDIAMMRLLVREGSALAVLPPIAVQDELASGTLIEADELPGIVETFFAVTIDRRFPNPIVRSLIGASREFQMGESNSSARR